jgi:hypothetical protein
MADKWEIYIKTAKVNIDGGEPLVMVKLLVHRMKVIKNAQIVLQMRNEPAIGDS